MDAGPPVLNPAVAALPPAPQAAPTTPKRAPPERVATPPLPEADRSDSGSRKAAGVLDLSRNARNAMARAGLDLNSQMRTWSTC